jgi:hypothetical protein
MGSKRGLVWLITVFLLAGCQSGTPKPEPGVVEPLTFATWPTVTDKPVQIGPALWVADCRGPTPEEAAEAKRHGPHASYSIVVRVSPEANGAFREGKPLPIGAIVVKEKYEDAQASGPLHEYAVMVKREAGYNPGGGDWEYSYVTLAPQRKVTQGRLANCAGCHLSARENDYLFRSYGGSGQ